MTIVHAKYDPEANSVQDPNAPSFNNLHDGYILVQTALPLVIPSSGSIGNNGALSGIAAMPETYGSGCYMYFPAGAIHASSSAGLYWVLMSSPTAGTIYQNQYTGEEPTIPTVLVPFVSTGPGAYTQTTASDITLFSFTVPGGCMGVNGCLEFTYFTRHLSSANAKTFKLGFNTSFVANLYASTGYIVNQNSSNGKMMVTNRDTNRQVFSGPTYGPGASSGNDARNSLENQIFYMQMNFSTATDWGSMVYGRLKIYPSKSIN